MNQSSGNPFASGPGFDAACQSGLNAVNAAGWIDACLAGVAGDWVIRAVVDCADPAVPAVDPWAHLVLALGVLGTGTLLLHLRASA